MTRFCSFFVLETAETHGFHVLLDLTKNIASQKSYAHQHLQTIFLCGQNHEIFNHRGCNEFGVSLHVVTCLIH